MQEPNIEQAFRIAGIIVKKLQETTLSPSEAEEIQQWLREHHENHVLLDELMQDDILEKEMMQLLEIDREKEAAFERLKEKIKPTRRRAFRRFPVWRYIAAAAILLTVFSTAAFLIQHPPPPSDVLPGSRKALFTVADGSVLALNKVTDSIVHLSSGAELQQQNGIFRYTAGNSNGINTITTPIGGEYQLILEDGSSVWLNANSTLRFPVKFSGDKRHVTLDGEAYFNVASGAAPFIVEVGDMEIQALGTQFNISAYQQECVKTTLVEGAVSISTDNKREILEPGQSAVTTPARQQIDVSPGNVEEVTAWKNGLFVFQGTPVDSVMDQLARWYGVTINYEGKLPPAHLNGQISRNVPISKVLHMLELTGAIRFKIYNRAVTVLPPV